MSNLAWLATKTFWSRHNGPFRLFADFESFKLVTSSAVERFNTQRLAQLFLFHLLNLSYRFMLIAHRYDPSQLLRASILSVLTRSSIVRFHAPYPFSPPRGLPNFVCTRRTPLTRLYPRTALSLAPCPHNPSVGSTSPISVRRLHSRTTVSRLRLFHRQNQVAPGSIVAPIRYHPHLRPPLWFSSRLATLKSRFVF